MAAASAGCSCRWPSSSRPRSRSSPMVRAGPGRGRAPAGHQLRAGLGRRRLPPACTRCSIRPPGSTRARRGSRPPTGTTRRPRRSRRSLPVSTSAAAGAKRSRSGCSVSTRLFGARCARRSRCRSAAAARAPPCTLASTAVPGPAPGERLRRRMTLPPRATLLASDGTPLAAGPGPHLADPRRGRADRRHARPDPGRPGGRRTPPQGYPPNAKVGLDGLERVFQSQLAGTPGGTLLAGQPRAGAAAPAPATPVDDDDRPGDRARGGRRDGRPATPGSRSMDPRTGAVLALAGIAFSALQPPGSTMKIITATGALHGRDRQAEHRFPVQTSATIDGYTLQNASGEACGGTLLNAFAVSCNSVFAPLGAELGGPAAGGDRRAVRLQPAALDPRRGREHDPVGEPSASDLGGRLLGDRPGHGAGHAARDGRRRRDDRDGRPAADPDPAGPPAPPLRPRRPAPRRRTRCSR